MTNMKNDHENDDKIKSSEINEKIISINSLKTIRTTYAHINIHQLSYTRTAQISNLISKYFKCQLMKYVFVKIKMIRNVRAAIYNRR